MKTKKLISIFLAAVLALALAVPALAAGNDIENGATSGNLTVGGSVNAPQITIRLPLTTEVKMILNPYKMEVQADATTGIAKGNNQVISGTYYAENLTQANVKVTVSAAVGSSAGDIELSSKQISTQTKVTSKSVFLYLDTIIADKKGAVKEWAPYTGAATGNQAIISATGTVTPKNSFVLAASADGITTKTGGCLAFTLGGDANGNPTDAWASTDKVDVTLTFSCAITSDAPGVLENVNK